MSILERYEQCIKEKNLFNKKDKLLVAVSGGVDSVVLCELCKQAGYDFSIAHCNFQLRGKESDRDEAFVKKLAEKYGVEFHVIKFDTEKYAKENKVSIQVAARELRYKWFEEIAGSQRKKSKQLPAHILTAHQADDNIETLLMNFFRGTGLHGLTGIPAISGKIRRPLLEFSKDDLIAFAKEHGLEWVEDSSNESTKYTRNYFRNELTPSIVKVFPEVKENLYAAISRFRGIEKLYQRGVGEIKKKLYRDKGNEIHIPVRQLMEYHSKALIYEIISEFGFHEKQVDELNKLSQSDSGKYISSASHRIIKHRHWFIIAPLADENASYILIEENIKEIIYPGGKLQFEPTSISLLTIDPAWPAGRHSPNSACLDLKQIQFPLLLRKWKTADYFYPLGMKNLPAGRQGKKKLSRFFIDNKLSKTEKENIWVIESAQRIAWVVGYRIDERFKITDNSKTVLRISVS